MFKKNKKDNKVCVNLKKQKGFVLLFAVVLTGIILSMAMGIASMTFKELSFVTSLRNGADAFFAADAGIECAAFQDKPSNNKFPRIYPGTMPTFNCFNPPSPITPTTTGDDTVRQYDFELTGLNSDGQGCARVTVLKDNMVPPEKITVTSRGYNIACNSTSRYKSERRLQFTSYPPIINVALVTNGGVASASSTHSSGVYPIATINNNNRRGNIWGSLTSPGGWTDDTLDSLTPPWASSDWIKVDFSGLKTINRIDVFTLQENYPNPVDPTPTMLLNDPTDPHCPGPGLCPDPGYGIIDFDVEYDTDPNPGSNSFQIIPGCTSVPTDGCNVSGNTLVWRTFNFPPVTTDAIRITVRYGLWYHSRIVEVEAWTP